MKHQYAGACVEKACKFHSLCHCGCNRKAKLAPRNDLRYEYVKGEPRRYLLGHSPACHTNGGFNRPEVRERAIRNRWGDPVSIARVRPLARWLIQQFGRKATCTMLGVHRVTLYRVAQSPETKYVSPKVAARISERVLMYKPRMRSVTVWDQWELPFTREPTPEERVETERGEVNEQRRRVRANTKRFREGKAKPRLGELEPKPCAGCGMEMKRKSQESLSRWTTRRYCSKQCYGKARPWMRGRGVAS